MLSKIFTILFINNYNITKVHNEFENIKRIVNFCKHSSILFLKTTLLTFIDIHIILLDDYFPI